MKSIKNIKINKKFLIVIISIVILFSFILIFIKNSVPYIDTINNDKQHGFISLKDLYVEKDNNKNIESTFIPTEIVWTGKVHWHMTYGRILFENLDPNAEYKYFIAEPYDVISDGGLRYSLMTRNINGTDVVKVTAIIKNEKDYCSDVGVDDTDYRGCVPWVFIDKIEIIE